MMRDFTSLHQLEKVSLTNSWAKKCHGWHFSVITICLTHADDDDIDEDCSIEDLAELNNRSCTPLVKATANFFLERSAALGLCKK